MLTEIFNHPRFLSLPCFDLFFIHNQIICQFKIQIEAVVTPMLLEYQSKLMESLFGICICAKSITIDLSTCRMKEHSSYCEKNREQ